MQRPRKTLWKIDSFKENGHVLQVAGNVIDVQKSDLSKQRFIGEVSATSIVGLTVKVAHIIVEFGAYSYVVLTYVGV